MADLPCRFIEENGTKVWLRVYWGSSECKGSYHNALVSLTETNTLSDWELGGQPEDYSDDRWPTACDRCGATVPQGRHSHEIPYEVRVHRQVFRQRRYNTVSGRPEPGDMFWATWRHYQMPDGFVTSCDWDNCVGKHLYVVLPNGYDWDTSGRASNCGLPGDRLHRCWVLSGVPPNVTAGKTGHTCSAGAGSIAVTGYHGFLQNGRLTG